MYCPVYIQAIGDKCIVQCTYRPLEINVFSNTRQSTYRPLEINVLSSTGLSSCVKSEVLKMAEMNFAVFSDVTPCCFVCMNVWKDQGPLLTPQIRLSFHHHSHRDNVTAPTGRPNFRRRLHFSHSRGEGGTKNLRGHVVALGGKKKTFGRIMLHPFSECKSLLT